MSIREATTADIPLIRSIALAAWPVAYASILSQAQLDYMLELMYSEAALRQQMAMNGHRFLLVEQERHATGFAGFEHRFCGAPSTRLHKLYVLPEAKGLGMGKALLLAIEDAARTAGDMQLELNVNRFNPSKKWYERQGFRILRDEVIDIGHGYVMDDHVMVKPLC